MRRVDNLPYCGMSGSLMELSVKVIPNVKELQFSICQDVEGLWIFPSQFFSHVETIHEPIFTSFSLGLFYAVNDVGLKGIEPIKL